MRQDTSASEASASARSSNAVAPCVFFAEERKDRFVFGPVPHRGEWHRVTLSRRHLPNSRDHGDQRSQDEWSSYLRRSEWSLGSAPFQMAYLWTLIANEHGEHKALVGEMLEELKKDYRFKARDDNGPNCAVTGSRVKFDREGKKDSYGFYRFTDRVVHDFGTPAQYDVQAEIATHERLKGLEGPIDEEPVWEGYELVLEALLGTRDRYRLMRISRRLCDTDIFLNRPDRQWVCRMNYSQPSSIVLHEAPESEYVRLLGRYVHLDKFEINVVGHTSYGPARGVIREKI